MKTMKSFMMLFSVALILGAVLVGSCTAQESSNYLKVRGEILNDYSADIYLYAQNDEEKWESVSSKSNKSKYSFKLATDVNYQIVFVAIGVPTKVVHIKSGDPGMYLEYVDIDFTKNRNRNAYLQQLDAFIYEFRTEIEYTASLE